MFLHWLLSITVVYKIGPRKNGISSGGDPIPDTDSGLPFSKGKKVKGEYSSSWNSPQNYGTSLVNGIPQCYLPPDRGDRPAFTPTGQVGTRFIDPVRMKGWVEPSQQVSHKAARIYTHRHHLLLLHSPIADTHFTVPRRVKGWVDLDKWLRTLIVYPPVDGKGKER